MSPKAQLRELARGLGGRAAEQLGPLPGPAEWLRLRLLPRRRPTSTRLLGRELRIADAASFLSGVETIFGRRSYDFAGGGRAPLIVDCGANIGLSTLFFKRRYPECRIVAFEPDPRLFAALRANVRAFGLRDVALYNQAVWTSFTTLRFWAEGAFSGRVALPGDVDELIEVPAVRLRAFLGQPVDLLKLDVEGAELAVLADCADRLQNVQRLFVEYHGPANEPPALHELLAILAGAGFRYQLKEAYAAPAPFVARPELLGMEYQADIFAYRP
jgi:FkbM family methyltransferase